MKWNKKLAVFSLYGVLAAGFCVMQYVRYMDSFERLIPYEHEFTITSEEDIEPLDLNKATAAQLAKLPNVSRPLAESIVAYRKELNGFTSIAQLRELPDMPEQLYLALGDYLYLTVEETQVPTTVPTTVPVTEPPETTDETVPAVILLDLNTASADELCLLPDIGEVTAAAIVAYREQIGGFTNRQQLMNIHGIGEKTYARISPHLYLENEQPLPEETVPVQTEPPELVPIEPTEPPEIPMINLNTATAEDLLILPECDKTLAQNIIDLREAIHGFSNPLELLYAEGMTPEIYRQWQYYLTTE